MNRFTKIAIFLYLLLYLGITLYNLDKIPVAWLDETMNLDPAIQWVKHGTYSSQIWGFKGTEDVFLAYLPLVQWVYIIPVALFPFSLFYTRLLWWIGFGLMAYVFYIFAKKTFPKPHKALFSIPILLTLYFIHAEGFTNAMRSFRVELWMLLLLISLFYSIFYSKNSWLSAFLLYFLALSHPSAWHIVGMVGLYLFLVEKKLATKLGIVLIIAMAPLTYFYIAHWDISAIQAQLLPHGTEHNTTAVGGNQLYNHFIARFLPIYKANPWEIIFNIFSIVLSITAIIKTLSANAKTALNPSTLLPFCIIFTHVYWYFALAPFARYTSVLVVLNLLFLIKILAQNKNIFFQKPTQWLLYGLLPFMLLPFWVRNIVALYQSPERDYTAVLAWIDTNMPKDKKVLLTDFSIGHFYANAHPNTSYSLPYSIHKFNFDAYDAVYQITTDLQKTDTNLISIYLPKPYNKPAWVLWVENNTDIKTYSGYNLYLVKNKAAFDKIKIGNYK